LGGYSYALLVIHFAERFQLFSNEDTNVGDELSLPVLLQEFFSYYARDFSWTTSCAITFQGLSKDSRFSLNDTYSPPGHKTVIYDSKQTQLQFGDRRLVLWDPIEADWNLGSILNDEKLSLVVESFREAESVNRGPVAIDSFVEYISDRGKSCT